MEQKLTEIARSYSQKINTGNYTSADFFCSQKMEVPLEEAEETSKQLFHFCKQMVERDIESYLKEKEDENTIDFNNLNKKLKETYSNQPEIKPSWKNKKEQNDFDEKEAFAHNLQDSKRGD